MTARYWSLGAAGPVLASEDTIPHLADPYVAELGWQEQAACQYADPELWFPLKGGSTREAKAVCRQCPVRAECLEYAMENDERFGIFGGLSERERRRLKKERAKEAPRAAA